MKSHKYLVFLYFCDRSVIKLISTYRIVFLFLVMKAFIASGPWFLAEASRRDSKDEQRMCNGRQRPARDLVLLWKPQSSESISHWSNNSPLSLGNEKGPNSLDTSLFSLLWALEETLLLTLFLSLGEIPAFWDINGSKLLVPSQIFPQGMGSPWPHGNASLWTDGLCFSNCSMDTTEHGALKS